MSSKNEKSKEKSAGILKPLAAAFFATEPEEDDKLLTPKPITKKTVSKPAIREPEPMIGGLSTEEARALLKEQLVGRISNEVGEKKEAPKKESVKAAPEKKASAEKENTEKTKKAKEIKETAAEAPKTAKKASKPAGKETKKAPDKEISKEAVKESLKKISSAVKTPAKKAAVPAKKAEAPAKGKAAKAVTAETSKAKAKAAPKAEKQEKVVKTSSVPQEIHMEYAGQSYNMDELVTKAVQVWTSVYKRSRRELWSVELYVKPQEKKAYYVLNKRKSGSIDL